jgi:hypothetical protein
MARQMKGKLCDGRPWVTSFLAKHLRALGHGERASAFRFESIVAEIMYHLGAPAPSVDPRTHRE